MFSNNRNVDFPIKKMFVWGLVAVLAISVVLCLCFWKCKVEPELIGTVRLDPAFFPDGRIYEQWHAVYEAYDNYPGTWVHPHAYYQPRSIDEWPDMDLENYTYIITYCQKIQSLSYYPWRENNVPTYTGAKEAHLILEGKTEPLTIFIYRIPKMRINNPEI